MYDYCICIFVKLSRLIFLNKHLYHSRFFPIVQKSRDMKLYLALEKSDMVLTHFLPRFLPFLPLDILI
jgi:hypothetical protein